MVGLSGQEVGHHNRGGCQTAAGETASNQPEIIEGTFGANFRLRRSTPAKKNKEGARVACAERRQRSHTFKMCRQNFPGRERLVFRSVIQSKEAIGEGRRGNGKSVCPKGASRCWDRESVLKGRGNKKSLNRKPGDQCVRTKKAWPSSTD